MNADLLGGSPWSARAPTARPEAVSLVDGTTFVVSSQTGVVGDDPSHGMFVLDTRIVSRWMLEIEGRHVSPVTYAPFTPFSGTFIARVDRAELPDAPLVVLQRRRVAGGFHEEIEIRNHGPSTTDLVIRLHVAADFASLFEVKAGNAAGADVRSTVLPDGLAVEPDDPVVPIRRVEITSSTPPESVDAAAGTITWAARLAGPASWSTTLTVSVFGRHGGPSHHRAASSGEHGAPDDRLRRWRAGIARLDADDPWFTRVVERSLDDLGSLRIVDPEHTDRVVVAAGSPWFMAVFGRDSLLSSWMALPFDQDLAAGVLAELADTQGTQVVAATDEEPGKILHEVRFDALSAQLLGGSTRYYGSVDATPLFVMLTAELARWTGMTDRIRSLLPAVDRALGWIDRFGDRDGDGFVEYQRAHERGLEHQGWKDSWDGIRHADGSVAAPPIALCEVQGYVYAAFRGRAELARACGDADLAGEFDRRATDLAQRFDAAFWLPDRNHYAVGLDAEKRPIATLTSNLGHLLWTGIVPTARARRVATALASSSMSTGFGLRTLSSDEIGFNPLSYHCGSVWPHDTAIAVAGLSRYGFDADAQLLTTGLFDAARADDGRLPELFGGFDRGDIAVPVPYPTACSPQAWAAASPLLLVRAMLGLEPDALHGRIRLRPRIRDGFGRVVLRDVPIDGDRVTIDAADRSVTVDAPDLHVVVE